MSTPQEYTFPGLWPFIELAAGGRDLRHLGRGRGLWHYKQVQDSLGQLPGLDADARRELLAHVAEVRESLSAALDGIDLAVRESIRAFAVADPLAPAGFAPAGPTEPETRRAPGSRRRRD